MPVIVFCTLLLIHAVQGQIKGAVFKPSGRDGRLQLCTVYERGSLASWLIGSEVEICADIGVEQLKLLFTSFTSSMNSWQEAMRALQQFGALPVSLECSEMTSKSLGIQQAPTFSRAKPVAGPYVQPEDVPPYFPKPRLLA